MAEPAAKMRRSHIDRTAAQLGIANGRRQARCTASQGFWRSDKPQTDGFGPLLTLGYVDGDTLPFRQAHDVGSTRLNRMGMPTG